MKDPNLENKKKKKKKKEEEAKKKKRRRGHGVWNNSSAFNFYTL